MENPAQLTSYGYKGTPERREKILGYLRMGATRHDAARAAGISYETFRVWIRTDSAFSAAVDQAEGECAAAFAATIARAAFNDDWKAAAWWLERRRRQEFGRRVTVEELTDEQVITLLGSETEEGSGETGADSDDGDETYHVRASEDSDER